LAESPGDAPFTEEYKRWQRSSIENIVVMLRSIRNLHGESVIKVASAAYASLVRQRWKEIAKERNKLDIGELFGLLWEDSKRLISYEVINRSSSLLTLKVNSCFWADEFNRMKAADIGYELCCMADFYIVEAFNPEIIYKRAKTLMKGDDCCDHSYTLKR
jgi:hypothetical protein